MSPHHPEALLVRAGVDTLRIENYERERVVSTWPGRPARRFVRSMGVPPITGRRCSSRRSLAKANVPSTGEMPVLSFPP